MEKLHLKNDTYQVWDRGTLWFQGTEEECNKYIAGDKLTSGTIFLNTEETNKVEKLIKIPELSDDEIERAAEQLQDDYKKVGITFEISTVILSMKWYREQLKSKQ